MRKCVFPVLESPLMLNVVIALAVATDGVQKRALAEKAARRRMLASVDSAKALRKAISRDLATRERLRAQRQTSVQEKLKQGLAGHKVGKHKVPEGQIDVQLGEELSESLRALKVSYIRCGWNAAFTRAALMNTGW